MSDDSYDSVYHTEKKVNNFIYQVKLNVIFYIFYRRRSKNKAYLSDINEYKMCNDKSKDQRSNLLKYTETKLTEDSNCNKEDINEQTYENTSFLGELQIHKIN